MYLKIGNQLIASQHIVSVRLIENDTQVEISTTSQDIIIKDEKLAKRIWKYFNSINFFDIQKKVSIEEDFQK